MVERKQTKRIPNRVDKQRIAEAIINLDARDKIQDRDSFDLDYEAYFDGNDYWINSKSLQEEIFKEVIRLRPNISQERIFKQAKGKSLQKDRQQTAKHIVTTPEEYKKKGASKVDLKGFDTKTKKEFKLVGKSKGKIVYARKTSVVVRSKTQVRFRDNKGRFVSVKN